MRVRMMIDLIRSVVNVVLIVESDILEMNKSIYRLLLYYILIKTIYLCKNTHILCLFVCCTATFYFNCSFFQFVYARNCMIKHSEIEQEDYNCGQYD
jgi:hypothetical protein